MEVEVSESKLSIPDLALKVGHGRRIANFAIDKIISLAIIIVLGIFSCLSPTSIQTTPF